MEQVTYKIADYEFCSKEEYQAGLRDARKILELNVAGQNDYQTARELSKLIAGNHIFFESPIGRDFLDKIDSCKKEYRKKLLKRGLEMVCYAVLTGGVVFLLKEGIQEYRSRQKMDSLQERVEQRIASSENGFQERIEAAEPWNRESAVENLQSVAESLDKLDKEEILPEYKNLYEENPDMKGWLTVDGTGLQYPVMQGPDNEYYLSHNFQKEYDKNGLLLMDLRCTGEGASPQYIVYGHNVQSGRMFGELLNYKEEAYFKYHPSIQFDTISEKGVYDIVAVFRTSMNKGIPFYEYTDFPSREEFRKYIDEVRENSLYDCGVMPEYGNALLALVTCEYSEEDGRFVVLAVKKE